MSAEPDRRMRVLEVIIRLEAASVEADAEAKTAAAQASRIRTELLNAENELHKMLGVEKLDRGKSADR